MDIRKLKTVSLFAMDATTGFVLAVLAICFASSGLGIDLHDQYMLGMVQIVSAFAAVLWATVAGSRRKLNGGTGGTCK